MEINCIETNVDSIIITFQEEPSCLHNDNLFQRSKHFCWRNFPVILGIIGFFFGTYLIYMVINSNICENSTTTTTKTTIMRSTTTTTRSITNSEIWNPL